MPDNDLQDDLAPAVAALVADLIFASRVRGAAPDARTVQRAEQLDPAVGPGTRLVLVDLQAAGALDAIGRLRAAGTEAEIVAFGSHVDTRTLQAARDAGASRVMARSAFVRELPDLVRNATRD